MTMIKFTQYTIIVQAAHGLLVPFSYANRKLALDAYKVFKKQYDYVELNVRTVGQRTIKRIGQPSAVLSAQRNEAASPDELWYKYSEFIDDDIDSLQRVAGHTVMLRGEFNKMMEELSK